MVPLAHFAVLFFPLFLILLLIGYVISLGGSFPGFNSVLVFLPSSNLVHLGSLLCPFQLSLQSRLASLPRLSSLSVVYLGINRTCSFSLVEAFHLFNFLFFSFVRLHLVLPIPNKVEANQPSSRRWHETTTGIRIFCVISSIYCLRFILFQLYLLF
jgi:hypothetical protein